MNINLIKMFVEQNIVENISVLIEDLKEFYYDELYELFSRIIIVDEIEKNQDAIEFYLVSEQLFRQLQKRGEATLKWKNLNIWGRTNCGQHIAHDEVIQDIVNSFN